MCPRRLPASRSVKPDMMRWTRRSATRQDELDAPKPVNESPIQHLVAFSGALLVIAVVVKSLRVAHMDLTTAQELVVNGNVANIVSGVLLLFFPGMVLLGLMTCAGLLVLDLLTVRSRHRRTTQTEVAPRTRRRVSPRRQRGLFPLRRRGPLVLYGVILTVLAIFAIPAVFLRAALLVILLGVASTVVIYGVLDSIAALASRISKGKRTDKVNAMASVRKSMRRSLTVGLTISSAVYFLFILVQVFNDAVWLPAEHVRIDGSPTAVAYEISRNDERVLLLFDETRRVRSVTPDQIKFQQPCRLTRLANSSPSLWDIVAGRPTPGSPRC